jgi:uncharacterized membrane protein
MKKKSLLMLATALLLLSWACSIQFHVLFFVFSLLALSGLILCCLIVLHTLQRENPLTAKLCRVKSGFNCNVVLDSKAARLTNKISLGDAGLLSFLSQFLFLLLTPVSGLLQAGLVLLAVPLTFNFAVTLWSLWYQWRIVQSWCKMCLLLAAVIWLQEAVLIYWFSMRANRSVSFVPLSRSALLLVCCTLIASAWLLIKPLILAAGEADNSRKQIAKWKQSVAVFTALLRVQPKINAAIWEDDILLGNRDGAVVKLVVAMNPFCAGCALDYRVLDILLEKHSRDIVVVIRFAGAQNGSQKTALEAILSVFFRTTDPSEQRRIIKDWFNSMDLWEWKCKYQTTDLPNTDLLHRSKQWAEENKITHTPDLFIDGHRLPKLFLARDLLTLMPGLIKFKRNRTQINPRERE